MPVMHQALCAARQCTPRHARHKTRGEVRGGGASRGSRRAPAARARVRSARRSGRAAVSSGGRIRGCTTRICRARCAGWRFARRFRPRLRDERLTVVDGLAEIEPKTKAMKAGSRGIAGEPVGADRDRRQGGIDPEVCRQPARVWVVDARYLNVRDILKFDRMLVVREAIPVVESLWGLPEDRREPSSWKQERMARRADSAAVAGVKGA